MPPIILFRQITPKNSRSQLILNPLLRHRPLLNEPRSNAGSYLFPTRHCPSPHPTPQNHIRTNNVPHDTQPSHARTFPQSLDPNASPEPCAYAPHVGRPLGLFHTQVFDGCLAGTRQDARHCRETLSNEWAMRSAGNGRGLRRVEGDRPQATRLSTPFRKHGRGRLVAQAHSCLPRPDSSGRLRARLDTMHDPAA